MFFVKSISILFLEISRTSQWKFSLYQHSSGGGGGEGEGEGYGRGLSGVWQLIQLSHGSLPMKYCLDVLRSCSVRFIFYTLHTFCSKKDC